MDDDKSLEDMTPAEQEEAVRDFFRRMTPELRQGIREMQDIMREFDMWNALAKERPSDATH